MISKKRTKPLLAYILAFLSLAGTLFFYPLTVHSAENKDAAPIQFIYVDGERVNLDDPRIQNIVTISARKPPLVRAAENVPNLERIASMSGEFERNLNVTMDGTRVSAQRYIAMVDGVGYEAFCGDPKLRGPESSGAIYEMTGEAAALFMNALKNGYPINSEWSNGEVSEDDRMWSVYLTRVAVAIANNPGNAFEGDEILIDQAKKLASGGITAKADSYPIMVNGEKDASDSGRTASGETAQSQAFEITHNRKTNSFFNPFRFEWAEGTPDGATLVIDGAVIATAPDNVDTVFGEETTSFQIEMPNTE